MNLLRTLEYFLKKKLRIRVWKFNKGTSITSKYFYANTDKNRWYIFPTILIDYGWHSGGKKYLIFFYWLNFLIRNE